MSSELEDFFDKFSYEYDKNVKKSYFNKNLKWVLEEIGNDVPDSILDIGCGTGSLLKELSHMYPMAELNGLDISSEMLKRARLAAPSAKFVKSDVHELPYEDNSMDLVLCTASFHHYQNNEKVMSEIYRILKPNGRVIILDSIRDPFFISWMPYYWDWLDSKECYSKHLHQNEFYKLFKNAKFINIKQKRKYKLLPVVHLMIEGRKRKEKLDGFDIDE